MCGDPDCQYRQNMESTWDAIERELSADFAPLPIPWHERACTWLLRKFWGISDEQWLLFTVVVLYVLVVWMEVRP